MNTYNVLYFGLGTLFSLLSFISFSISGWCVSELQKTCQTTVTQMCCVSTIRACASRQELATTSTPTSSTATCTVAPSYQHKVRSTAVPAVQFVGVLLCLTFVFVVARRSPPAHVRSFLEDGVGTAGVVGRHDDAHGGAQPHQVWSVLAERGGRRGVLRRRFLSHESRQ